MSKLYCKFNPTSSAAVNFLVYFLPSVLPMVGLGSRAHSAGLVEIAVRLCLNQREHLCPHVWVPILKPQRPCIRPPNRRVVFADKLGFSLTAVRVFSHEEDQRDLGPLPSLQGLGSMTGDAYSCTVSTCCPGTQLKLGFPQPSLDFQSFRAKLAESMVTLENCAVTEQALQGSARVRNLSFQKDVRVRITFDSWYSYRDVPCTYVQKRFGGPQTDIFEFDIAIPKVLDAKRKIEFCLMYLPAGQSEPFWDNNNGQNYSILVCVNSHLCHGKSESA
uniref:Protein phosphatase 1 regulatory subunit 3C2, duplicate b n=1 Tax=Poecilia latipinna TaxID=48699 RepID=A0A3B3VDM0_9TELE